MAIDPNRQLPDGTETVNERFIDGLVRHQIGLLRLSGSVRKRIFKILDDTETDVADQIKRKLKRAQGLDRPADVRRLNELLVSLRAIRSEAWDQIDEILNQEIRNLAKEEPKITDGILKTVAPVELDTVLPTVGTLTAIVTSKPFEGKVLRDWARNIRRADISRIEDQIRIGLTQGESSQQISRRIVGTVNLRGRNGVTEITRRNAEAIVRTAVIHTSNQARREFFKANDTLFDEELYVATLDARTTPICRSLDGDRFPVGEGPIPPLHFNCRSLRVGIIDGEVIGQRPARTFTQRQLLDEFTRNNGLAKVTNRSSLPRGFKGKFDDFSRRRMRELTGRVPAKVSYQEWLGRQTAAFQDDVLGKTRGRLFRRGDLELTKFVNRQGDEIPLSDLARRERKAFEDAGLDPEDFL